MVVDEYRMVMNTDVDDNTYILNNGGTFIKFHFTSNNLYFL